MKTNFLLKIFYIFFVLLGIQSAYADQLEFTFLYGVGIESMAYTNISNSTYTVTTSPESTQLVVKVKAKNFSSSSGQANVFNSTYGPYKMGLGTNATNADATDILVSGTLIINGEQIVGKNFALAHEHKSHNWWIASNPGHLYNTQPFSFEVQDSNGKQYCLLQNYKNFQITVVSGACQQSSQLTQLLINWDKSIESVTFSYAGDHDDMHGDQDYLQTVYSGPYNSRQIAVNVYSQLEPSSDIAQAFIDLFPTDKVQSWYYYTSFRYGGSPSLLDYYIRGALTISDNNTSPSVTIPYFNIGFYQDPATLENVFWVGSKSSATQQTGVIKLPLHCAKFTAPNVINIYAPDSNGNC